MGLFSKAKKPDLPQAAKFKTADELFSAAINWARNNNPNALNARESALSDLQRGNDYYAGFQPTSFEQALGNQQFANVMPDVERSIMQKLSMSGIESSPILAEQIGKARGDLGVSIGQILANLGNERARYSLSSRLGIDPSSVYDNYLTTDTNQSNMQSNSDFQRALMEYQNAMGDYAAKEKNRMGGISSIGSILGGGVGLLTGGMGGAALGSSLGSTASTLFGGDGQGINFGDALSVYKYLNPKGNTA